MTEFMEKVSEERVKFDYEKETNAFILTFAILNAALAGNIFSGTNSSGNLVNRFLSYHFEAFTLGVQSQITRINIKDDKSIDSLRKVFTSVKNDAAFKAMTTGGGKNYQKLVTKRINFVKVRLAKEKWM